jgi:para-nitrobenzyl esterase
VGTNEAEAAYPYSTRPGGIPDPADDNAVQAELVRSWGAMPSQSQQLVAAYRRRFPADTPQQLLVSIATGFWMWQRANRQAELKARLGGAPVYVYQFGWKEHVLGGRWAIHSAELIFLFDKLDMESLYDNDNASLARAKTDPQGLRFRLRDTMIASWAAFAKAGNPSNRFVGQWRPFTLAKHETMRLDGHSSLLLDPLGPDIRNLWDSSTA